MNLEARNGRKLVGKKASAEDTLAGRTRSWGAQSEPQKQGCKQAARPCPGDEGGDWRLPVLFGKESRPTRSSIRCRQVAGR